MSFDPGVDSMRAAGIPVTRQPYAEGSAGIRQSLDAMALKMREGRIDSAVIGWAGQVLKAAGLDGRDRNTTPARQAAALLDALRESAVYAPDAYGAEVIQSAAATLCLRPGLCLNRGDCDDLAVAFGSATLSLGIPTQIVKQNFGGDTQEHVLIVVWDGADWQYADPSTKLPFGSALKAASEVWVDPMAPIGNLPEAKAEIVTLGRPNAMRMEAQANTMPHWPQSTGLAGTRFVWPADVTAAKKRIDTLVTSVTVDVGKCTTLSQTDRDAWTQFLFGWRQFYCGNDTGSCDDPDSPIFGSGGQLDQCDQWEIALAAWQKRLAVTCHLTAPQDVPPKPIGDQPDPTNNVTTWLALGTAIVGGVLLISILPSRR